MYKGTDIYNVCHVSALVEKKSSSLFLFVAIHYDPKIVSV